MNNTQTHTPTANDAIWRAMEQSGSSPDYIQAHLSQPPVADSKPLRSIVVAVAPEILADCLSQGNYA